MANGESTTGSVLSGAAQGAAVGAAGGPIGIGIGAAIGAIGGFLSASGKRKGRREERRRRRRVRNILSSGAIQAEAQRFLPEFRALVAGGVGPGIEGRVAGQLAQSGLTDTGAGEAIRALSASVPGVIASQSALEFARGLQFARAQAELGFPALPEAPNAVLAGAVGGLSGGLGTFLQQASIHRQTQQPPIPAGVQAGIAQLNAIAQQTAPPTAAPLNFQFQAGPRLPEFNFGVAPFQPRRLPMPLF